MTLSCVAGDVWRPGEGTRAGWLLLGEGRVVDEGEGKPPQAPDAAGFVMPAPINAHTHVGDRVARGRIPEGLTLAQLVAPPDGLKHRILRATPPSEIEAGIREAASEMRAAGIAGFTDFREGGEEGARMLRRVAPEASIFGRCADAYSDEEAERVLAAADGYGLSAMKDAGDATSERAAALARRLGKRFALHLSEDAREDVGRALALRPAFVVHCVKATREDLRALADARVPIVVCPRSNARFGPLPDVAGMREEGATLALGSDNAMMHPMDVMEDARALRHLLPREALLDALVVGGRVVARGSAPRSWLRKGDAAEVVVYDADPLGAAPARVVWTKR